MAVGDTKTDPITGKVYEETLVGLKELSGAEAAAKEAGILETLGINAARTLRGMGQFIAPEGSVLDQSTQINPADRPYLDALREERPVSSAVGSALPYMATLPLGGGALAQMGITAGLSAMDEESGGEWYERALMGAGLTGAMYGVGNMGGRVGRFLWGLKGRNIPTAPQIKEGVRQGFKYSPAERTLDPSLAITERQMLRTGAGARAAGDVLEHNRNLMNNKAARAMGVTDDVAPGGMYDAVQQASTQLGREFADIQAQLGDITLPGQLVKKMVQQAKGSGELAREFADRGMPLSKFGRIVKGAGGKETMVYDDLVVPGDLVMDMRSLINDTLTPNASALTKKRSWDMLSAIDDTIEDQVGAGLRNQYAAAREQWRALMAIDKGKAIDKQGNISPVTLWNNMRKTYGVRRDIGRVRPETQGLYQSAKAQAAAKQREGSYTPEGMGNMLDEITKSWQARHYYGGGRVPNYDAVLGKGYGRGGGRVGAAAGRLGAPALQQGLLY